MKGISEKRTTYREAVAAIADRRLIKGINTIQKLADSVSPGYKPVALESEEEIYHQMLRYFMMDAPDPSRNQLRDDMSRRLLNMADVLYARALSADQQSDWHSMRQRVETTPPFSPGEPKEINQWMYSRDPGGLAEYEQRMERLFCGIWMAPAIPEALLEVLRETLFDEETEEGLAVLLVSALILHNLEKFSPEVWMLLADIYTAQMPQQWQRALVGMLLVLIRYDHRMHLYPGIEERLETLAENPLFVTHLEKAIIQLIRTGDTEKVSRRIQEEIIPEMMKIAPKIQEQLNLDQLIRDEAGEEKNPEWEKFFEDSPGMFEKMEELNQLQMEGADLFISTFSRLKSFPFFHKTANWFLPFDHRHPTLTTHFADEETNQAISGFLKAFKDFPVMCNSDKYSFSFNLSAMPEMQRTMLINTLSGEITGVIQQSSSDSLVSEVKGHEVFHQFTQDLYRFFRLHPLHNETEDPFAMKKQTYQCAPVASLLQQFPNLARRIGEYYFQNDHYTHAISLFSFPEQLPQESPELFQKIAYSWQMKGDLDKALEYYRKAELFDSNALWNLRKIAWVYQLQHKTAEAIAVYRDAERLAPESVQIKLSIGNLYLQQNEWDKALMYYRQAEELNPETTKTLRPVAWCLFLKGDLQASAHYYEQIMEREFNHNDLLNFGHVKFALLDKKGAAELYKQSIQQRNNSPQAFAEAFQNDEIHLERLGITSDEIAFMFDGVMLHADA